MSAKFTSRSVLQAFKRHVSARANTARQESTDAAGLQVSKLPNGVTVASLDSTTSPVARVVLVANVGPRFEESDQLGITHCLRVSVDQANKSKTAFELTRHLTQIGANLSCTATRENLMYSLDCLKDNLDIGVSCLVSAATQQAFKPWEIQDCQQRIAFEAAVVEQQPEARLTEMLHQVAYRDTLGRSLYAPSHMFGKYSSEMLMEYVNKNFTAERMAVIGLGIGHKQLTRYLKTMSVPGSGSNTAKAAKYSGGEVRHEIGGDTAYAAIVTEGLGSQNKDAVALSVLQCVMGCGPTIKWSNGSAASKIIQAAGQATDQPFATSCINTTYSDSGLFGFYAVAHASQMGQVLKAVLSEFGSVTKNGVADQDVQKAKMQVKACAAMMSENGSNVIQNIAQQLLSEGTVQSQEEFFRLVDSVSKQDVVNVAKKVINGKPSMAAIGNLSTTPHLDELM